MQAYVKLGLLTSDYTEVCCDNEKFIGYIFGSTGIDNITREKKKKIRKLLLNFISGKSEK
jgi:hypothetical protein